jgi:Zn-dependent M28 family amino/carboxypeptidase
MLAGTIGERNLWRYTALQRAAEYVEAEFGATGLTPGRKTYEISRVPVSNIEASLAGTTQPEEIVVIGAHYDTITGCPGANDNGSGVAAVLELTRRFAARPQRRTLRFVAFVNEEPPFFQTGQMGSLVYANAARAHRERVVAMLSLETMGYFSDERGSQQYPGPVGALYPDIGNFIGFVSNLASARLLMKARRAFKRRTPLPLQSAALPEAVPGVGWSDHWSFWQAGYPALMVTDTAPFRYPWYHTAQDTPDKLDYARLDQVVDGLEAVIEALAT